MVDAAVCTRDKYVAPIGGVQLATTCDLTHEGTAKITIVKYSTVGCTSGLQQVEIRAHTAASLKHPSTQYYYLARNIFRHARSDEPRENPGSLTGHPHDQIWIGWILLRVKW